MLVNPDDVSISVIFRILLNVTLLLAPSPLLDWEMGWWAYSWGSQRELSGSGFKMVTGTFVLIEKALLCVGMNIFEPHITEEAQLVPSLVSSNM